MLCADVNFASGLLTIDYDTAIDPRDTVVALVRRSGHGIEALGKGAAELAPSSWWTSNRTTVAMAASGALISLGWALDVFEVPAAAVTVAYALAILAGGTITWRRALVSLKARMLDMNVLMTIAVIGAAAIGQWQEGATVIFLFALGGWLESRSLARTRRSIRDLLAFEPELARVRRFGADVLVPPAEVLIGETLVVRPGERVALDGVIATGSSALDEAPVTGESVPVDKAPGDRVFAGTLNTSGLVEIEVTAISTDSTLARIIFLVEEAQAAKAPSQQLVERFSRWYTPAVVGLAVFIAIVPPIAGPLLGQPWGGFESWLYRALVLLVISCPCALVISTPVAIVSAITRASRDGILVKGGAFLETAAKVRAIAFDKTGTLTFGKPEVVEVFAEEPQALLALAASLEANSNHPLARAVVAHGERAGATLAPVAAFEELPGRGVAGVIDGRHIRLLSPSFASEIGDVAASLAQRIEQAEEAGRTVLVLIADSVALGYLAVADTVRPDAAPTAAALRAAGIEHLVMLTGDNERTAAAVAGSAGLSGYHARLLPEDKTNAIRLLRERYGVVAMVGDGINDAPALAAADLGIVMGAAGSDTAVETADVALMRDDLSALPGFFALGRRTVANITQNVTLSIVVKFAVLVLAILGKATLWMAVFADTGVALIVIANGLRLLKKR
ncbi:MAG: heavy metal translocating P-type ATPase [Actinomycetota bacterium]|nr:heavy metal translocating P-type ATPase [Actinomycetota bacterium]